MINIETEIHKAFNIVFLAASSLAIAVILSYGMADYRAEAKPAQIAYGEVWECSTDVECEQEYFDKFGEWPQD